MALFPTKSSLSRLDSDSFDAAVTRRHRSNAIDAKDYHKEQLRARRVFPRVPLGLGRGLLPVPLQ